VKIAVIGAGIVGVAATHALAERGWLVTLLLAPETNGKLLTESSAVSQPATVRTVKSVVAADGGAAGATL
jgi:glycine/D-amino acid oxidase-like deaminating enzyme